MARSIERVGDQQTIAAAATTVISFTDIPSAGLVGLILYWSDAAGAGVVDLANLDWLRVKANQLARYDIQRAELLAWQERFSPSHKINPTTGRVLYVPLNAFWNVEDERADLVGWEPGASCVVEAQFTTGAGESATAFLGLVKSTVQPMAYQTLIGQDPGIGAAVRNRQVRFGAPGIIHSLGFDTSDVEELEVYLGGLQVMRASGNRVNALAAADSGDMLTAIDFLDGGGSTVTDPVFVRMAQGLRADPSDSWIGYTTQAATGRFVVHTIVPLA